MSPLVLVLFVSIVFASTKSASAQTASHHDVVLRSYNTYGVPLSTLEQAQATFHDVLAQAGIDAGWRECRTPDGPSSRAVDLCDDILPAAEVMVRIVRAPERVVDTDTLGYSHVDPYLRRGKLATVFGDRIRALSHTLQIDEGTMLGRAMAHEVGHLLLGNLEHSLTGVMRGEWRTVGRARENWLFSSAEAVRMRDGLSSAEPPVLAAAGARPPAAQ